MLKHLTYIIFLFIAPICSTAQTIEEQSNAAYQAEDYTKAIELLENELKLQNEKGLQSAELHYNLGNAYFRDSNIAKAILNYERAILIAPGDKDIRNNIKFVQTQTEDKIVEVDDFFLLNWFESIRDLQSSNAWAKLSIAFFLVFILSLVAFFLSRSVTLKKVAFYTGITLFVLLIFTNVFSISQMNKVQSKSAAIIMAGSAPVYNSPDSNSKELFILHSGTKVKINKEDKNWLEIEIDNGNVGWISREKLEII